MNMTKYLIDNIIAIVALLLSMVNFISQHNHRKLDKYKLKEVEQKKIDDIKPKIKACFVKNIEDKITLQIWNNSKAKAYNINFVIIEENNVRKDKTPFKCLDPDCIYEEYVIIWDGMPKTYHITISWMDENNKSYQSEQILSL